MVGICGIPLNKGHMLVTACQTTPNYSKTKTWFGDLTHISSIKMNLDAGHTCEGDVEDVVLVESASIQRLHAVTQLVSV